MREIYAICDRADDPYPSARAKLVAIVFKILIQVIDCCLDIPVRAEKMSRIQGRFGHLLHRHRVI